MRIVHFSWEFPPAIWGGLGTFAMEVTQKQVSMGNDVTVFALNHGNKLRTSQRWNGVEVFRPRLLDLSSTFSVFVNRDLRSWGANFRFFADVLSYNVVSSSQLIDLFVNNGRFDVIDAHDWLGIIAGMISKEELDIPLFFHVHSTEFGRSRGDGSKTIKNIELEGGMVADCVITVSYAMKEELRKLGFSPDKIRVCWNGVDPLKYDPMRVSPAEKQRLRKSYGVGDDETLLFFIGRLVWFKGVENLVKAMPSVFKDFPETKLLILGVGDLEKEIRRLIKELGLNERVSMRTEFVSEKERILHYAAADIVVLPSLYEPFGIVCSEAMAMGKPVVVGAKGTSGMREQVISSGEKQCGVHMNPFDPSDIAWGIKQVMESEEKGYQMGRNGRERVVKEFNWDIVAKRTLDIYKEFL
jgi:glycosyltransferase involved in cell wall biosynthesis